MKIIIIGPGKTPISEAIINRAKAIGVAIVIGNGPVVTENRIEEVLKVIENMPRETNIMELKAMDIAKMDLMSYCREDSNKDNQPWHRDNIIKPNYKRKRKR